MARETKVGLLAGLAFIICFTVILSHRGGADLIPPNSSLFSPPQAATTREGQPRERFPSAPRPELALGHRPGDGGQAAFGGQPSGPDFAHSPPVIDYNRGLPTPEQAALQSMTQPVPRTAHPPGANAQRALEDTLARIDPGADTGSPIQTAPGLESAPAPAPSASSALRTAASSPPTEPAAPSSRVKEYVIQPGDTLSKIAQAKLGGKSKSIIDAILDLNRQRISDPNQIQSGSVLLLPSVTLSAQPSSVQRTALVEDAASRKPAQSKSPPAGSAHNTGARWYQVRKNDRYVSIARAELGDASRWEEIHRLNRDKFPNPDQIREGVRIKLPGK